MSTESWEQSLMVLRCGFKCCLLLINIKENDENYLEEITDEKILTSVISVFTARHLEETTDDEQED